MKWLIDFLAYMFGRTMMTEDSIIFETDIRSDRFRQIIKINFNAEDKKLKNTGPSLYPDSSESQWAWDPIPAFTVLTGKNGSGKSQLLKYIHETLSGNKKNSIYNDFSLYQTNLNPQELPSKVGLQTALAKGEEEFNSNINSVLKNNRYYQLDSEEYKNINKQLQDYQEEQNDSRKNDIGKAIIEKVFKHALLHLGDNPLTLLASAFKRYEQDEEAHKDRCAQLTKEYVTAFRSSDDPNLPTTLEKKQLLDDALKTRGDERPWKAANRLLKKNAFKYEIKWEEGREKQDHEKLTLINEGLEINIRDLSSGEFMMLHFLSWLYGYQETEGDSHKILLLDEPDKHLDPYYCKLFFKIIHKELVQKKKIQVIMVSHRIDTVALAPNDSIYTIQNKDGKINIVHTHKLLAFFRMSPSIRQITGFHHKIHTESGNDAKFYEGTYRSLLKLSNDYREDIKMNGVECDWPIENNAEDIPSRKKLLSRRYQFSFYSVSTEDNAGNRDGNGNNDKVIKAVIRTVNEDNTALDHLDDSTSAFWKKEGEVLNKKAFYNAYGIIDRDKEKTRIKLFKDVPQKIINRIKIINRYSIENHLYDPIVFSIYAKAIVAENKEFDDLDNDLSKIIGALKEALQNNKFDSIQTHANQYFTWLREKLGRNDEIEFKEICILNVEEKSQKFELKYPTWFLSIAGHKIENAVLGSKKGNKHCREFTKKLSLKIYGEGLNYVPVDLLETFVELTNTIRNNMELALDKNTL